MKKLYKHGFLAAAALVFCFSVSAQNSFFTDAGENTSLNTTGKRVIIPQAYRAAVMQAGQMKDFLWSLPAEETVKFDHNKAPVMELPMPDGKMARFHVWESSIMEPGLAAKFPEIKTFAGQGIDDPYASIRMSYNPYFGFAAQILSANTGRIFIDAYARWDINNYISYFARDSRINESFRCDVMEYNRQPDNVQAGPCRGTTLLTYRLALACTGEYAVAVCAPNPASIAATAAEMTNAVNRVTGVYESETSVRMTLISNNNLLIYLDGATDPYTNNNGGTMLGQNQANIDAVIGSANYDIGHVFSTGGGGVAGLGVVCRAGNKARGVTGLPNPEGDDFYIDYVAHEMGHQFGGNHTFNSITSNCGGGNRNGFTAYEVGSGTTIQAYAGICGTDNTQPHSDAFFHTVSFDEISNYVVGAFGGSCPASTVTGNILPVITAMNNNGANIPIGTPFTLSASATDGNSDPLTYCWEEWDLGPGGTWDGGATSTTAPLFKSRVPKISGDRTFPDIAVILAGYPVNPPATMGGLKGETLPQVARAIKFRLTVRDNRAGGGGVVTGGDGCQAGFTGFFQVNVIGSTGPFVVTAPNGGESWQGGSTQTITWNPAGTDLSPISVANVRITLSTDGGLTYPTVLSASTNNDGSEALTMPCVNTTTARVRVEAVGNIFFDISNGNFSLQSGFNFNSPAPAVSGCPVPASMSITLGTIANCSFSNPINMSASGNPAGTTVSFTPNPVTPGNNVTVTLNGTNTLAPGSYTFSVIGTASGAPVQTRSLTFIISAPVNPSITTHPANQTVCVASNATFNVTATDASAYQWQVSTGGGPFTDIPGANGTSYTVVGATAGMNGNQYRVIASAACASPVTSNPATLIVISPVTISAQPVASTEVCSGNPVSFTVTGSSTQTINYQWQVSPPSPPAPVFTNIPGANSATFTIPASGVTTAISGTQYRVLLSNATCTAPTISNIALLTVRQTPTVGLTAAPLTSLLPGKTTTLTATPSASTGGVLTTTWYFNTNPLPVIGNTYVVDVEHVGTYQVKIQEAWPSSLVCSNQSPNVVIDATISNKLFIFPSPNDGRFTVSYFNNGGNSTQREIVIFDSKGGKVYDRKFPITGPYTLLKIDLHGASRGIYFVLVGDASGKKLAEGKVHVR